MISKNYKIQIFPKSGENRQKVVRTPKIDYWNLWETLKFSLEHRVREENVTFPNSEKWQNTKKWAKFQKPELKIPLQNFENVAEHVVK